MSLRALLRSDPTPVTVGPHTFLMPAATADVWLIALEGGDLQTVVPGMLAADDRATLAEGLIFGSVTHQQMTAAAKTVIRDVAGRPWFEVVRIAGLCAAGNGERLAQVILAGVDPGRVTIGMWCAAVIGWMNERLDAEGRTRFEFDLRRPPDGDFSQVEGFDSVQFR